MINSEIYTQAQREIKEGDSIIWTNSFGTKWHYDICAIDEHCVYVRYTYKNLRKKIKVSNNNSLETKLYKNCFQYYNTKILNQ